MPDFTSGPWRIASIHAQGMFLNSGAMVVTSDTDRICEVDCQADFKRGAGHAAQCSTRDANARLIAAAPTMFAALDAADEALAQFTAFEADARAIMGNTNFNIVQLRRAEVRAAIAKALGASPARPAEQSVLPRDDGKPSNEEA